MQHFSCKCKVKELVNANAYCKTATKDAIHTFYTQRYEGFQMILCIIFLYLAWRQVQLQFELTH